MEKDLEGLPNVDLAPVIDDIKNQSQQDKDQTPKETLKDQFKTEADRIKGYKELQGFATRVSQENKSLKEEMERLKEQRELEMISSQQVQQQQQYQPDPDIVKFRTLQISDVLEEEAMKNRAEFQERYAYANAVSKQYPNLATTPMGVKKLFELGDQLKIDSLRKNANKALEAIFGEPLTDEETAKLRKLVKGDKAITQTKNLSNAYMPDTSTSTKTGFESDQKPNFESQIKESAQKGDVDGVIQGIFSKVLAE